MVGACMPRFSIDFQGVTYLRRSSNWLSSSNLRVPQTVANQLDTLVHGDPSLARQVREQDRLDTEPVRYLWRLERRLSCPMRNWNGVATFGITSPGIPTLKSRQFITRLPGTVSKPRSIFVQATVKSTQRYTSLHGVLAGQTCSGSLTFAISKVAGIRGSWASLSVRPGHSQRRQNGRTLNAGSFPVVAPVQVAATSCQLHQDEVSASPSSRANPRTSR